MMRIASSLLVFIGLLLVSCAEETLDQATAERFVQETIAKMPAPAVTVYVGAMTDETYLPTYRAIAADKKYLLFEESVFIKEANRNMPRISLTEEGKKVFSCERNRCSASVCTLEVARVDPPRKVGREWHVDYTIRSVCDTPFYAAFKPLAERQFIRPQEQKGTIILEKKGDSYEVKIP